MRIAVAIPNHNQHEMVTETIKMLYAQPTKPAAVYVMSDAKPFWNIHNIGNVLPINNKDKFLGRCGNRNSVIKEFLWSPYDALVFLDGDCYPDTPDFLGTYARLLDNHDLVFGTRRHDDISGLINPPSDLLTANMDNMWAGKPIDYTDLRMVSGAVSAWKESKTFNEKLDLMLTGMIGWSCNFGFSKKGLMMLRSFQEKTYGLGEGIFDSEAFGNGWGYEDVAMGIDALYAGLDIDITDTVRVGHRSHNRSDGLFDHVKGRHAIMERHRMLERYVKSRNGILRLAMAITAFFTAGLITGMVTMGINLQQLVGM